jgi:hypothetical protein
VLFLRWWRGPGRRYMWLFLPHRFVSRSQFASGVCGHRGAGR